MTENQKIQELEKRLARLEDSASKATVVIHMDELKRLLEIEQKYNRFVEEMRPMMEEIRPIMIAMAEQLGS